MLTFMEKVLNASHEHELGGVIDTRNPTDWQTYSEFALRKMDAKTLLKLPALLC